MRNPYEDSETLLLREVIPKHQSGDSDEGCGWAAAGEGEAASGSAISADARALADETVAAQVNDDDDDDDEAAASSPSGRRLKSVRGATVEEVLDRLFPPTAAPSADGVEQRSVAARGHVDRMAVINLQEQLDRRCAHSGARPVGVCPLREGIYGDALNELIRQVTVTCPERGELLAALRDEVCETNATYDRLFDASCQFAVRKAIERDLKRTMRSQLDALELETGVLQNRVNELRAKRDGIRKRFEERRAAEDKKHQEEVSFLKRGNQQLTHEIKRLTS